MTVAPALAVNVAFNAVTVVPATALTAIVGFGVALSVIVPFTLAPSAPTGRLNAVIEHSDEGDVTPAVLKAARNQEGSTLDANKTANGNRAAIAAAFNLQQAVGCGDEENLATAVERALGG